MRTTAQTTKSLSLVLDSIEWCCWWEWELTVYAYANRPLNHARAFHWIRNSKIGTDSQSGFELLQGLFVLVFIHSLFVLIF